MEYVAVEDMPIKPLTKLPNGAVVIASKDSGDGRTGIVLAYWENDVMPYITWRYWFVDDEITTESGRYSATIANAAIDFEER